jgi:hypothetical protein
LLIDCEEDRTLPAVLVGMLREAEAEVWRPQVEGRISTAAVLRPEGEEVKTSEYSAVETILFAALPSKESQT